MIDRVPVLDQREFHNLDWPAARYEAVVDLVRFVGGGTERVGEFVAEHTLSGARGLEELVQEGSARWCLEVRSPVTYLVDLFVAEARSSRVEATIPKASLIAKQLVGLPGLVAINDCKLQPEGLHEAWEAREPIFVPAGTWLVRGQHVPLVSPLSSIVSFEPDKTVQPRLMKIAFATSPVPHWVVSLNPDDLERYQQDETASEAQSVTLAGLTAALADARRQPAFAGDPDDEQAVLHPAGDYLVRLLRQADPECLAPGDDGYDPLYAATLLAGDELLGGIDAEAEAE